MKIKSIKLIKLETPIPVYDLTSETNNFKLASGIYVHNSKDCSDAVCGAYYTMLTNSETWRFDMGVDYDRYDNERADFSYRY